MTAAAFKATYAEWRVIKTRAAVQIVFELPVEKADEAYQALGGMPIAAREVWCAIARLNTKGGDAPDERNSVSTSVAQPPSPTVSRNTAGEAERRKFSDMSPAQQAGMLSNDEAFQKFLIEKFGNLWSYFEENYDKYDEAEIAAACIRYTCKVQSRSEITSDNADWSALLLAYRLWQREPEFMPA